MRVGRLLAGLLLAAACREAAAERLVLAWPPTRYDSAELVLHAGPATPAGPVAVSVRARGLEREGELPEGGALRIELPPQARCAAGVEACAIVIESAAPGLRAVLQSPSTNGVPDTLARTAHDAVRAPRPEEAGRLHVVLSAPNSPDFAEALSFASVVPLAGGAVVEVEGGCASSPPVALADGEVLTLACAGAGEDLGGAIVRADAPVALFSGNRVAPLPLEPGSGASADLVLDAPPALEALSGGSTWLVPPLPRAATHAGLGDLVRCAAAEALSLRVRDDRGRDESFALAAGERLELDTADPGGEPVLRLDADGPLACWQLTKSRLHRGLGDPAAVPLVPRELFTRADEAFAPDGYGARTDLVVVAEAGAVVSLDGRPIGGFTPGPAGQLQWALVELPEPVSGEGLRFRLAADAPFGAWLLGQGGYKAHGLVAARGVPAPALVLLRGARADALEPLATPEESAWSDPEPAAPLWFYRVREGRDLRVSRCGGAACLDWSAPGGG